MTLSLIHQVLLYDFAIATVMGAVAYRTSFCTMGAVSDWINMGDTRRLRAWLLAIAIAIAGAGWLEAAGLVQLNQTLPPYRSANFMWPRYLLGGFLFGIGMTLASGCGYRTMVRIGGGNLKSIVVLLSMGAMAYAMTRTDFYAVAFHSWMQPLAVNLRSLGLEDQSLVAMVREAVPALSQVRAGAIVAAVLSALLAVVVLRARDFRHSPSDWIAGITVGLAVVGGWYITGGPLGRAWLDEVDFMEIAPTGAAVQSYTFVNPTGELLAYVIGPDTIVGITFGVAALAGITLGALLYALATRNFRFEWFVSAGDFFRHLAGGALMGVGGVLAMGCTIGQAVTGVSTLALGSFLAFGAIVFGSALTMKIEYYRMVYEGEASFLDALLTTLADMHLLPAGLRRLEPV